MSGLIEIAGWIDVTDDESILSSIPLTLYFIFVSHVYNDR